MSNAPVTVQHDEPMVVSVRSERIPRVLTVLIHHAQEGVILSVLPVLDPTLLVRRAQDGSDSTCVTSSMFPVLIVFTIWF